MSSSMVVNNLLQRLFIKLNKKSSEALNLKRIRASVISHWITKYNLREVQYRAGHRYVSSTEKYKQQDLKDLQEELGRYFPI